MRMRMGSDLMWEHHWGMNRDPFREGDPTFVATPVHAEAVARLVHAIETGQRSAALNGAGGTGKSTVLNRALAETWSPLRKVARVTSPTDGLALHVELAERLGRRVPAGAERALAWRRLAEGVRLCHWQGQSVVFAVDDSHQLLTDPAARLDMARLVDIAPRSEARVTLLRVGREGSGVGDPASWELSIRLLPLTRGAAGRYLADKLASAGRDGLTFTPGAITRLHALSGGVPRGLDRLASLSLMAGAMKRLEVIPPEVVEGVTRECIAVGREGDS
jgi:MSHA biogenesis protein MshM